MSGAMRVINCLRTFGPFKQGVDEKVDKASMVKRKQAGKVPACLLRLGRFSLAVNHRGDYLAGAAGA